MTLPVRERLHQAVQEAAGALVARQAVPVESGHRVAIGACVRIALLEPEHATLSLWLSESDADTIGRAAWGDPASTEQVTLALCELANVVAGRFLAVGYPDADVRIGFPERVQPGECACSGSWFGYDLEGCRLDIRLS